MGDSDAILFSIYNSYRRHIGGILLPRCNVVNLSINTVLCAELYTSRNTQSSNDSGIRIAAFKVLFVHIKYTSNMAVLSSVTPLHLVYIWQANLVENSPPTTSLYNK